MKKLLITFLLLASTAFGADEAVKFNGATNALRRPTAAALKSANTIGDTGAALSQFAATTSAQLRGVLSDETGTGPLVFSGGDIGAATATSINGLGLVGNGFTLTVSATGAAALVGEVNTWTNTQYFPGAIEVGSYLNSTGNTQLGDSATDTVTIGTTAILLNEAAGTLALRNGTTSQALRIYNTYSSAGSNYERMRFNFDTTQFAIATESLGTGTNRSLALSVPTAKEINSYVAGTLITQVSASGLAIGSGGSAIPLSKVFTKAISTSVIAASIGTETVTATGVTTSSTFAVSIPLQDGDLVLMGVRGGTDQIFMDWRNVGLSSKSLTGTVTIRSF